MSPQVGTVTGGILNATMFLGLPGMMYAICAYMTAAMVPVCLRVKVDTDSSAIRITRSRRMFTAFGAPMALSCLSLVVSWVFDIPIFPAEGSGIGWIAGVSGLFLLSLITLSFGFSNTLYFERGRIISVGDIWGITTEVIASEAYRVRVGSPPDRSAAEAEETTVRRFYGNTWRNVSRPGIIFIPLALVNDHRNLLSVESLSKASGVIVEVA